MSAGAKLCTQDRKEVEKFVRFIVIKTVQVVVQSRLGEKIKTKSKPHSSGSDWFNLSISDVPEVLAETKRAMAGRIPTVGYSMCCEISLKTADGDSMALETWTIDLNGRLDTRGKSSNTVYNRLSLLLKSVIAIARVTPAYKLSSRQGPDSYVICYRIYMGEPQYHLLGEDYQEMKVGEVTTALGILNLGIVYRTKMTITPEKCDKGSPFLLKSDYFKVDMSPRNASHPLHLNDFLLHAHNSEQDNGTNHGVSKFPSAKIEIKKSKCDQLNHRQQLATDSIKSKDQNIWENSFPAGYQDCGAETLADLWDSTKIGAFATSEKENDGGLLQDMLLPDTPFLDLLKNGHDNSEKTLHDSDGNVNTCDSCPSTNGYNVDCNKNQKKEGISKSIGSDSSLSDDFVMIELRPPFAECDGNSDLGAFFCECQCAPPLTSFSNQPTLEEQVTEITCQLQKFETNKVDFDNFVDSLCQASSQK